MLPGLVIPEGSELKVPLDDQLAALGALRDEGLIAAIGLSHVSLAQLEAALPAGIAAPQFLFKQSSFIERSVGNVQEALRDGALFVAVILFLFLLNVRTTLISLTAIPLSLLATALVIWVSCRIEGWKSPKLCRIPIDRLNITDAPIRIDHF